MSRSLLAVLLLAALAASSCAESADRAPQPTWRFVSSPDLWNPRWHERLRDLQAYVTIGDHELGDDFS